MRLTMLSDYALRVLMFAAAHPDRLVTIDETLSWVQGQADLSVLVTAPDTESALDRIGTPAERFDWLYSMWSGKPGHFFLSWEAIGHGYNHLGELTSTRNRMGLSPF